MSFSSPPVPEVSVSGASYIPDSFIPDESQKLELYRRLSKVKELEELDRLAAELRDRYGQLPPEAIAGDENARVLLEREQESLWALRTGAGKPHCNFDLAYNEGPNLILNHLAQMRRLARHARRPPNGRR